MDCSASNLREKLLASPAARQWTQIPIEPHHGVAIPLFSLHSANSCGIGEYLDLIPFISWCQSTGLDNIQLLPINDTGYGASPYNALTAHGLHPIFLSLSQLPHIDQYPDLLDRLKPLQKLTKEQRVDYQRVLEGKEKFLQIYFQREYDRTAEQQDYRKFIKDHDWLENYALFKILCRATSDATWEWWPEKWKNPSTDTLKELYEQNQQAVAYHQFVQYLCFQQMQQVKVFASRCHFYIQGDIPILINRHSADVWSHRKLFNLAYSAGSTPDMYSNEGQNWGFPIYEWQYHELDNYHWWHTRLQSASGLFHLYRLDHIVGFFRLWAIPLGYSGRDGRFIPEDYFTWLPQGEKILKRLLDATIMLPIGEDLGMIPNEVRPCLRSLGICGTKVMRWERHWEGDKSLIKLEDYIPESMTTLSTHDSEPLQLWWQNQRDEALDYCKNKGWEYSPVLSFHQRQQLLWDSHHTSSLFHINPLQEYLALLPELVWPNPEDERINVPGTVSERNWTYRLRPSIEELEANSQIKQLIAGCLSAPKHP